MLRQTEPVRDPLGAFDAAPTSGRQAGEGKYAEHNLQIIHSITLVAVLIGSERLNNNKPSVLAITRAERGSFKGWRSSGSPRFGNPGQPVNQTDKPTTNTIPGFLLIVACAVSGEWL